MKRKKRVFWILLCLVFLLPFKAQAWGIKGSWDANTESDLAGYNVYLATTYDNASQLIGDIVEFSTDKTCFCYEIDDNLDVVFIAITARNDKGDESDPIVGYLLFGNVWGTYEDGVPYTDARVDGQDLTSLGLFFSLFTSHQEIDCSGTFVVELTSLDQRSDLDKSGRSDGIDLIKMALRFGNTAQ